MVALLVLVIVLPPLLLLLGVGLGVAGARWWLAWHATGAALHSGRDEEAPADGCSIAAASSAQPSTTSTAALPPGRKDSCPKLLSSGIHIVASSASLPPTIDSVPSLSEACLPLGVPLVSASSRQHVGVGRRLHRPAALQMPHSSGGTSQPDSPGGGAAAVSAAQQLADLAGLAVLGGGSSSVSPGGAGGEGSRHHRKTASMDLSQLVRVGPSVISQVMDDWDARSTLYRIMSLDNFNLPSPQQQQAAAAAVSLLSPAAAALFTPAAAGAGSGGGGQPMAAVPPGEVHMDEIDLMECIGKGGYGCVYKGSWRGAGVAVKYIVCPTDDSDSLGRAIREVVLSKKMSHPNVVQCYSWTVLTEPDPNPRSASPVSRSGVSSPREQSFTSRRRQPLLTGRSSLELLRPGSASLAGTPGGARRGLDLRFKAVAAPGGGAARGNQDLPRSRGSPTALHRIAERPTQEGCALQQDIEATLGPTEWASLATAPAAEEEAAAATAAEGAAASPQLAAALAATPPSPGEPSPVALGMQPTADVIEELVAEAAVEHQQAAVPGGDDGSAGSDGSQQQQQQYSPDVPAAACFASSKQLKLHLPLPPSSRSPSSSPGIQAVHAPGVATGAPAGAAASVGGSPAADVAGPSAAPSPDHHRVEAYSVEPASLPDSPFAARAVQALDLRRSSSSSSGSGGTQVLPLASPRADGAERSSRVMLGPQAQTSEEDEGEDVYARFSSYEEMVEHFQQLAAEAQQAAEQEEQAAAAAREELGLSSSLRYDGTDNFTVTAASSFSDVLSMSGFMLEGTASGAEFAALSLPSSPRHGGVTAMGQQQLLRSGQSSWFFPSQAPSVASTHPITPRNGAAAASAALNSLSRLARAASAATLPIAGSSQPSLDLQLTASMPAPAWPSTQPSAGLPVGAAGAAAAAAATAVPHSVKGQGAEGTAAGPAANCLLVRSSFESSGSDVQEQGEQQQQPSEQQQQLDTQSSQGHPAAEHGLQARSLHGSGAPAARHSSTVSLSVWQPAAPATEPSIGAHAAAAAAESILGACAAAPAERDALAAGSAGRAQAAGALVPHLGGRASSGNVTPRLCSLANLGGTAGMSPLANGSLQVTPRQTSMRGGGSIQLSPRADSLRGRTTGRRRVEELREEAAAALGRGGSAAAADGIASCDRVSLGSHNDSFNSEEGFGSPVKQRCGGVKDVFQLEELQLSGQEALMVVVMEYCDLGSLRKALQRKAFRPSSKWPFQTTYRALLRTAQEVAKGMGYIHEFNIVHGDLKPGNVLLKTHKVDRRGYIAKVSDFGLSRPLDFEDTHATLNSGLGTIAYTSPETFVINRVTKPSDVYSFGIMLWEMFYCQDPYDGLLDGQICLGVSEGTLRPEFDDDCPEPYRRLAQRCWHQNPEMRPSFEEVDRELVRIEMEFRLHRHRANSKRASSASAGGASAAASRPGSPGVQPRGSGGVLRQQLQASALAD